MPMLARLKGLRGTALDIFGKTEERRMERRLIAEYVEVVEAILRAMPKVDYAIALALAGLPERIRGFGHVKEESVVEAAKIRADLIGRLVKQDPARKAS